MLTFAKLYKTSNYVIPAPISSAGGGYGRVWSPIRPKHGAFGNDLITWRSREVTRRALLHELRFTNVPCWWGV